MAKKHFINYSLLIIILSLSSCSIFFKRNFREYLDNAERAEKQGNYDKAIKEYNKHIKFRLKDDDRLSQENPWFYQLMIGELFLKLNQPIKAETSFLMALEHNVSAALCAERLRRIAGFYEKEKNYEKAFEILRKHRDLDPILFDLEIDRIHKASLSDD